MNADLAVGWKAGVVSLGTLEKIAEQAGEDAVRDADLAGAVRLADELDRAALIAIARTLRRHGLFTTPGYTYGLAEIYAAPRVAPRHRPIVRRWLDILVAEGLLTKGTAGYRRLADFSDADLDHARRRITTAGAAVEHGPGFVRFFDTALAYLPELLRDEIDPWSLHFAADMVDVHRRDVAGRYCAAAVAALIADLVQEQGVGTEVVEVDGVTGYSPGRPAGTAEIVLVTDVLHDARHVGRALTALRTLLAPGGILVFIETTREHYRTTTSTRFLLSPPAGTPSTGFADFRAGSDRMLPTAADWRRELVVAGFEPLVCVPAEDHPLARFGQHVIVGHAC
ncbi:hypothetical protein ALI22I_30655 [Saccharothrix sp. ALI-22-I]|uniref:hypothetical protein n=1 Tax=Saccharothrix sp. ALI-22-I TaxID=1933778 RepID=UPI00097C6C20|nr:hypothetical protein [Saccharothrix sp. ALI-22-I]ONI84844.1 hypothetical protein ALI22I_30655 [Saccharothrix sp. ALI-22-I]